MSTILTLWNDNGQSLRLVSTSNTVVSDLTSIDSKRFHISIDSSDKVLVEGLTIRSPADSPNTDGIHIDSSNVHLRNLSIGTGTIFPINNSKLLEEG